MIRKAASPKARKWPGRSAGLGLKYPTFSQLKHPPAIRISGAIPWISWFVVIHYRKPAYHTLSSSHGN